MICYYCGDDIPDDELVEDGEGRPMHRRCKEQEENKWRGFIQPVPPENPQRLACQDLVDDDLALNGGYNGVWL